MDPQARAVLDHLAAWKPHTTEQADDARWLADFRYQTMLLTRFDSAPERLHGIAHVVLGGEPDLIVRLYRPCPGTLPLLLHMHGGGAIAGSVDGHDSCLRALARHTGWLVAAPLYRLAPEHRFPAQIEDGERALNGLAALAEALEFDKGRIVISGDSIGASLATTIARRCSAGNGPKLAGQILLYPNTDLRRHASYRSRQREDGNIIASADLERQIELYLANPDQRHHPDASPILASGFANAPPALIVTCGADPLRDEGEAYSAQLRKAGLRVAHRRFEGMIHAFMQTGGCTDATAQMLALIAEWLRELEPTAA